MNGKDILGYLRTLLLKCTANPLSTIGTLITVSGFILFTIFVLIYLVSSEAVNPYYGALVFLGLPGLIAFSVSLIVAGRFFFKDKPEEDNFWVKYLNVRDEKNIFIIFGAGIALAIAFMGISNMQVGKFMNSTNFCGETCHIVMEPEAVAHANSSHSTVQCVECHVGEGVDDFIMSKWRGLAQVVALTLNAYERPVPTPVHSLPSSEDTCIGCHDTSHKVKEKMNIYTEFQDNKEGAELVSAVIMNVGSSKEGSAFGVHAHSSPDLKIKYFTTDPAREQIQWIEATTPEGIRSWTLEGYKAPEVVDIKKTRKGRPIYEIKEEGELREMDCTDCHNRVGHEFRGYGALTNEILKENETFASYPRAKEAADKIFKKVSEKPKEQFRDVIEKEVSAIWKTEEESGRLSDLLIDAANKYLYPRMNIDWGTYKSMNGHSSRGQGCFRCHNQRMKDNTGLNLTQDCESCHVMVADKVLKTKWENEYLKPVKVENMETTVDDKVKQHDTQEPLTPEP